MKGMTPDDWNKVVRDFETEKDNKLFHQFCSYYNKRPNEQNKVCNENKGKMICELRSSNSADTLNCTNSAEPNNVVNTKQNPSFLRTEL